MVITVEDLIKNKIKINNKSLDIEKDIDEYLINNFDIKNQKKKISYLLCGDIKKYYKNNYNKINELYENAGWNIKYKMGIRIENYRTEELVFNCKKIME